MLKIETAIWRDDGKRRRYVRPEILLTASIGYGLPLAGSKNSVHVGNDFEGDNSISGGNYLGENFDGEDIGEGGGANVGDLFAGEDLFRDYMW